MDHSERREHGHLPSTEAAVSALHALAAEYGRGIEVTHDIGADQTSRRSAAGFGVTTDPDGSLPHEAYAEFGGLPRVSVRLFPEGDARITVEGVDFHDVPRDDVPAFLHSVFGDLAHVRGRRFPPTAALVVPLPGDRTYREQLAAYLLTPWLSSRIR
ncbi:hypothetical protein ACIQVL_16370 [Streptomyces sp. NPDC090499]|uniref:hypothetical protein n=1 Tax=unclassified Streptomyces TaxID=2593676 RepID=UPI00381182C2